MQIDDHYFHMNQTHLLITIVVSTILLSLCSNKIPTELVQTLGNIWFKSQLSNISIKEAEK